MNDYDVEDLAVVTTYQNKDVLVPLKTILEHPEMANDESSLFKGHKDIHMTLGEWKQKQKEKSPIKKLLDDLNKFPEQPTFGEEELDFEDEYIEGGIWFKKVVDDKNGEKKVEWLKLENNELVNKPADEAVLLADCMKSLKYTDGECNALYGEMDNIYKKQENYQGEINTITDELAKQMTDKYDDFKKSIKDLHPKFILLILSSFGFTVNDNEAAQQVNSVEYWVKNTLRKHITDDNLDNVIIKNKKLLNLLQILVNFINANPGILNPDQNTYDTKSYDKYVRGQLGENNALNVPGERDRIYSIRFSSFSDAIRYVKNAIALNKRRYMFNPISYLWLMRQRSGFNNYFPGMQYGGGNPSVQVGGQYFQYQVQQFNNMSNVNCSTRYANMMFQRLKSKLAASNKKLHTKDEEQFKIMVENLKKKENKMYQFLSTMGDYVDNNRGYSSVTQTIRYNDMKRFVDGLKFYGVNIWNQEEKLMDALLKLAIIVDRLSKTQNVREVPIPLN